MIRFTGSHRAHPQNPFLECFEAYLEDGRKVSCEFTHEALHNLGDVEKEELAEYCRRTKGLETDLVFNSLFINLDLLMSFRNTHRDDSAGRARRQRRTLK